MSTSLNDDKIISCDRALDFGTVEKLCPKYGFIKCLSKSSQEKKLFFHSSATLVQYDDLVIGDYVTFERTIANGKPLATNVQRSCSELIEGSIVKMPRRTERGSISYEISGESFFVAFDKEDVMEDGRLRAKDEVSFEKVDKDGISYATRVRRRYNKPVRVQGVVTAVKDKFGFIDRSDIVKEIYFNLSATPNGQDVKPGDELEFNVKHLRNGKEEAVNLRFLEKGTVRFVQVIDTLLNGTLLRSPDPRRSTNGDLLAGNISYVYGSNGKVLQIPFGERDKKYPYSMHPGDIVSFKVAVDLRDQLQRAYQVELCLDSFPSRKETRHMGVIKMFDGTAGLIEPDLPNKTKGEDMLIAFKAKEWLLPDKNPLRKFMAVSYTPLQITRSIVPNSVSNNSSSSSSGSGSTNHSPSKITTASRILPAKEGQSMTHLKLYASGQLRGTIQSTDIISNELGIIVGTFPSGEKRSIAFTSEDVINGPLRTGDEVEFGCMDRINCPYLPPAAFDVKLLVPNRLNGNMNRRGICGGNEQLISNNRNCEARKQRSKTLPDNKINSSLFPQDYQSTNNTKLISNSAPLSQGWIVILKENFGFIESWDHENLFKFKPYQNGIDLQVGKYVEFVKITGNRAKIADNVKLIDSSNDEDDGENDNNNRRTRFRVGQVIKPLSLSDGSPYPGIIKDCTDDNNNDTNLNKSHFNYTMKSLLSFRSKLSQGDRVLYRVCAKCSSRAVCVTPLKQFARILTIPSVTTESTNEIINPTCGASTTTIRRCSSSLDDSNFKNQSLIPVEFEFDCETMQKLSSDSKFNTDDLVELTLDLKIDEQEVVVNSIKHHKQNSTINHSDHPIGPRKVYKCLVDDSLPKVLHLRSPRLPETDSIGFTIELKKLPKIVDTINNNEEEKKTQSPKMEAGINISTDLVIDNATSTTAAVVT